jgi:hypothetical protein
MTRAAWTSIASLLVSGAATLVLAGCPSPPDDHRDGGGEEDGGEDDVGLILQFAAKDELPIEAGDQTTIERVELALRNLRAIGDAAPGDERTTREMVEVVLAAESEPEPVAFMSAPPGVYSRIEATIDGSVAGTPSYRIAGTVTIGVDQVPFEITDLAAIPLVVSLSQIELEPAEVLTIEVRLDVKKLLEGVDVAALAPDPDGTIRIDQDDPQILLVRDAIDKSFEAGRAD